MSANDMLADWRDSFPQCDFWQDLGVARMLGLCEKSVQALILQ